MDDVDIDKITASKKVSCKRGYKHFIGYKDDVKVIPLCNMLPQRSVHAIIFDETKYMIF